MGLGLCVVDHVYVVERLDFADERTRFTSRLVLSGGMIGTALAQAATLGCDARVLSVLGDDADGRLVRDALRGFGVGTRGLILSADSQTTVAVALVERRTGERRFVVADRRALERGTPDFDLRAIDARTVLLVDGHFPAQALRAVKRARSRGATVVGDFNRPSPAVRRLLPYVDYPIVPAEFAARYGAGGPRRTVRELAERFGGTPIVTLGAKGGLYWNGTRVERYEARRPRARIRDTTGAGDVFHGAFAASLTRDARLSQALALGARAAAQCCTAYGGTGRLLTPDQWPRSVNRRSRVRAGARAGRD